MKKITVVLISIFCFVSLVYAEEVKQDTTIDSKNNSSENSTTDLTPNAKSAIMIEASTGEIIYEKNSNEELPMASMTKMMTMLLIMESIDNGSLSLDEKVTASEYASSMGGSQIFLEPGETMTVDEMLKGIAIGSGNDASVAKKQLIYTRIKKQYNN